MLARPEFTHPFSATEFIENILVPEVAICLIIEDMQVSASAMDRSSIRQRAYLILYTSRDFGELMNGIAPFRLAEDTYDATWTDMEPWSDGSDQEGVLIESDTDDLLAEVRAIGERPGATVTDGSDAITLTSAVGPTVDINGTYQADTGLNEVPHMPPMHGVLLPYGVTQARAISPSTIETINEVMSPIRTRSSKKKHHATKAAGLRHIPMAAERVLGEDAILKRQESRAVQLAADTSIKGQKAAHKQQLAREKAARLEAEKVEKSRAKEQTRLQHVEERTEDTERRKEKEKEQAEKEKERSQKVEEKRLQAEKVKEAREREKMEKKERQKQVERQKRERARELQQIEKGRKEAMRIIDPRFKPQYPFLAAKTDSLPFTTSSSRLQAPTGKTITAPSISSPVAPSRHARVVSRSLHFVGSIVCSAGSSGSSLWFWPSRILFQGCPLNFLIPLLTCA